MKKDELTTSMHCKMVPGVGRVELRDSSTGAWIYINGERHGGCFEDLKDARWVYDQLGEGRELY